MNVHLSSPVFKLTRSRFPLQISFRQQGKVPASYLSLERVCWRSALGYGGSGGGPSATFSGSPEVHHEDSCRKMDQEAAKLQREIPFRLQPRTKEFAMLFWLGWVAHWNVIERQACSTMHIEKTCELNDLWSSQRPIQSCTSCFLACSRKKTKRCFQHSQKSQSQKVADMR